MTDKFPMDSIPDGFIRDYLEWIGPTTEAPDEFHVLVALAVLGTVTERKVYVPHGLEPLYPNIWGLLVGPSGISRKSSALKGGKKLLRIVDKTFLVADDITPEKFVTGFASQPTKILFEDELGDFLAKLEKSYMSGMKEKVTKLFDNPPEIRRELMSGDIVAPDPFFSFMAASTPNWLWTKLKEEDLYSGFLNRWIAVTCNMPTKTISNPPPEDIKLRSYLVRALKDIRKLRGPVKFTEEIKESYSKWYGHTHAEIRSGLVLGSLGSFYTRLEDYTKKIALLLELAKGNSDLIITPETLESAIAFVNYFKTTIRKLVEEELVFTNDMRNKRKVLTIIRDRKEIKKGELLNKSNLLKRAFDPIIETLIYEGLVEIIESKQEGRGRRGVTYRVKED